MSEPDAIDIQEFVKKRADKICVLTGVSFVNKVDEFNEYRDNEDAQHCTFVLDDVTYTAIEDPSDGYRSSLNYLIKHGECSNLFPVRCFVHVREAQDSEEYRHLAIVELVDIFTREVVLAFGTDNTDDYYPSFVAVFKPENMACNRAR